MRLRLLYRNYFEVVARRDDRFTPELAFYHLKQDGWWMPIRMGAAGETALEKAPSVADANTDTVFAQISAPVAPFPLQARDRMELRMALLARYFPWTVESIPRPGRAETFSCQIELKTETEILKASLNLPKVVL